MFAFPSEQWLSAGIQTLSALERCPERCQSMRFHLNIRETKKKGTWTSDCPDAAAAAQLRSNNRTCSGFFISEGKGTEKRHGANHTWLWSAGLSCTLRSAFSCTETKRPFTLTLTRRHPRHHRNQHQLSDINLCEPSAHSRPR